MPVKAVKGGYRWGTKGKTYKTREQALRQGRAIEMAKKGKKRGGRKSGR